MKFIIHYPPTKAEKSKWAQEYGLNAYWSGKHWAKRKADADYWHSLVRSELRKQGIKPRIAQRTVEIWFYWDDRLDVDNHAAMGKMILDALKGLVVKDDSRRYVTGVHHLFHRADYILVEVRDAKEL